MAVAVVHADTDEEDAAPTGEEGGPRLPDVLAPELEGGLGFTEGRQHSPDGQVRPSVVEDKLPPRGGDILFFQPKFAELHPRRDDEGLPKALPVAEGPAVKLVRGVGDVAPPVRSDVPRHWDGVEVDGVGPGLEGQVDGAVATARLGRRRPRVVAPVRRFFFVVFFVVVGRRSRRFFFAFRRGPRRLANRRTHRRRLALVLLHRRKAGRDRASTSRKTSFRRSRFRFRGLVRTRGG
mmetsp:Transcript_34171/g.109715  ORF Transcript_34171/g.109715 Transcript_34171/m.109715 type:complete len:236 (+) Transcript_34171:353-1060(+)